MAESRDLDQFSDAPSRGYPEGPLAWLAYWLEVCCQAGNGDWQDAYDDDQNGLNEIDKAVKNIPILIHALANEFTKAELSADLRDWAGPTPKAKRHE